MSDDPHDRQVPSFESEEALEDWCDANDVPTVEKSIKCKLCGRYDANEEEYGSYCSKKCTRLDSENGEIDPEPDWDSMPGGYDYDS